MTRGDRFRKMSDMEIATLIYEICHERDQRLFDMLTEIGVPAKIMVIEVPSKSIMKHYNWLQEEIGDEF